MTKRNKLTSLHTDTYTQSCKQYPLLHGWDIFKVNIAICIHSHISNGWEFKEGGGEGEERDRRSLLLQTLPKMPLPTEKILEHFHTPKNYSVYK